MVLEEHKLKASLGKSIHPGGVEVWPIDLSRDSR